MPPSLAGARRRIAALIVLSIWLCCTAPVRAESAPGVRSAPSARDELPAVFHKPAPEGVADLRALEDHVASLVEKLTTATVGVRVGRAQGSGVLVSPDGYVLTAAHVSGAPGQRVEFILPDGRRARGRSLGRNQTLDAGLMKIDEPAHDWPHAEMADQQGIRAGDWCVATGHPGGYHDGRTPVFRLGRVITVSQRVIQTDCELVGGDSGGPLFDMHGRVIGVNSRIGPQMNLNFHVPIAAYADDWDRLKNADSFTSHSGALLGVSGRPHALGLEITKVYPGEPAALAGVRAGDVLVAMDTRKVRSMDRLIELIGQQPPGRRVRLELLRENQTLEISVRLGMRQD